MGPNQVPGLRLWSVAGFIKIKTLNNGVIKRDLRDFRI